MRKTCMFCGGAPVTEEHIWPQRLRKKLPDPRRYTWQHSSDSIHELSIPRSRVLREQQKAVRRHNGNMASRYLKVVCGPCNGGWMSGLQTRAQNYLDPLMEGRWPALDEDARHAMAAWITMLTMVVEAADPTSQTTSESERDLFRETREPLPNWTIWLGRFGIGGPPQRWWNHRAFALYLQEEARIDMSGDVARAILDRHNTQLTVTLTGHLVAIAFSSRVVSRFDPSVLADAPFRRIWPDRDPLLGIAPAPVGFHTLDLVADIITDSLPD